MFNRKYSFIHGGFSNVIRSFSSGTHSHPKHGGKPSKPSEDVKNLPYVFYIEVMIPKDPGMSYERDYIYNPILWMGFRPSILL